MSILVVGSVAYDTVNTPSGSRVDSLGGSAMYFSISSSYFTGVSLVAVVGEDFDQKHVQLLESHKVDVSGLERRSGKTFRWSGVYSTEDVNTRSTLDTQLNVFAEFSPKLTAEQRRENYLFLANIDPELQLEVLGQMESRPKLVALDSMNFWIEGKNSELNEIIRNVDVLFMDEGEAREFSGQPNLIKAAKHIMSVGPKTVIIKRGEHGVLLFQGDSIFAAPAFPLESVVDPTGAGDSFAGGFMGYLAATDDLTPNGFRRATVLGSVMGSFCVEDFSADRIGHLSSDVIEARFREFAALSSFNPLAEDESLPKGHS
ncbi:MAG: PfkB family carbohydrate kinase [Chloroflexi bacterium]|nr:PfkB family carbohydrate kinase [Chloroflexota bacterium]MDA1227441.1 PfkB family carbohydrate kinase [Chloroflexota bacterium]